eukprot:jgi/Botrbrau1/6200/Bobra.0344s0040.1
MREAIFLAFLLVHRVAGRERTSPPPPALITPTLLDFDEPDPASPPSTPDASGLSVSAIGAALPQTLTLDGVASAPVGVQQLEQSLPPAEAPTLAVTPAACPICPVCPTATVCPVCPAAVACPPAATAAPACPPATPAAPAPCVSAGPVECPICTGGSGVGADGKPVADLLYQVIASSGSFDPTQQKLILEGVVGVITALKIDPATDAKFARRHTPGAFFSDKFNRNGTWLNKPNAGLYASLGGNRAQQLTMAFQIGVPTWSSSRSAVQLRAIQVDPRSTLALTGGIANAIVNQEAADGKVQVAKSQIRFTDILMFIDSQYQK